MPIRIPAGDDSKEAMLVVASRELGTDDDDRIDVYVQGMGRPFDA